MRQLLLDIPVLFAAIVMVGAPAVSAEELSNYVGVKDRIAVYTNDHSSDGSHIRKQILSTYEGFGIKNVHNISLITRRAYSYKGILIDGTFLNKWVSPSFNEFMTSRTVGDLVEHYVKSGGILIVAHSYAGPLRLEMYPKGPYYWHVPNGDLWAPANYTMTYSYNRVGAQYAFNDGSPLAQYLKQELVDYTPWPYSVGFRIGRQPTDLDATPYWNVLVSGKDDSVPRVLELTYGQGRILLYAGPLSYTSCARNSGEDAELLQACPFLEGFLRYIATYSRIQ